MKKTLAEIINEENKTLDVTLTFKFKGLTVHQQFTADDEGEHDWQIWNPVNGWGNNYYQGWSYQEADQDEEADYEQILVDAVKYSDNMDTILDTIYNSYNHEKSDIILFTDDYEVELFELENVPATIEVEMTVEF